MEILTIIYLTYIFLTLYFLSLFVIIFLRHRNNLFEYPRIKTPFSVSVIIPAYNEGKNIFETVESVIKTKYEKLLEIILVNDGSKDDTLDFMKQAKKKYPLVKILDKTNSGKADSINQALKIARGELICVIDSDSFPREDAFSKTVGFFEDKTVGVVTIPILSRRNDKFLDRVHTVYQILVASNRKFLEKVDGIFVTPGPFALYRKSALDDIGGFDTKNITEDIEATWHLASKGWKIRMSLDTQATTILPNKLKQFFRQRVRWTIGGFQTMIKYKKEILKHNPVGYFILPFFAFSIFVGFFTLILGAYLFTRRFILGYTLLRATYLSKASFMSLVSLNNIPNTILIGAIFLLCAGAIFSAICIGMLEKKILRKRNILFLVKYVLFMSIFPPLVFITAIFKFMKKDIKW